jgi:hypothetical protein
MKTFGDLKGFKSLQRNIEHVHKIEKLAKRITKWLRMHPIGTPVRTKMKQQVMDDKILLDIFLKKVYFFNNINNHWPLNRTDMKNANDIWKRYKL